MFISKLLLLLVPLKGKSVGFCPGHLGRKGWLLITPLLGKWETTAFEMSPIQREFPIFLVRKESVGICHSFSVLGTEVGTGARNRGHISGVESVLWKSWNKREESRQISCRKVSHERWVWS